MKRKGFTLIELIFVLVVIAILTAIALPKFKNIKNHALIETLSYITTAGAKNAVQVANNLYNLEENTSFKLKDILTINTKNFTDGLELIYSNYKDGTYSIRDTTYSSPQVAFRITLDLANKTIEYKLDCSNFKASTHPDIRALCFEKWPQKVDEKILF